MGSCGTCRWAKPMKAAQLVRCTFPLPMWVKRELLNPHVGGELADHLFNTEIDCPTYEPITDSGKETT